jgi:hypothetical protein
MNKAAYSLAEWENTAMAIPGENRMVCHHWPHNVGLSPTPVMRKAIDRTIAKTQKVAAQTHSGRICTSDGAFKNLLLIGIGLLAYGNDTGIKKLFFQRVKTSLNGFRCLFSSLPRNRLAMDWLI